MIAEKSVLRGFTVHLAARYKGVMRGARGKHEESIRGSREEGDHEGDHEGGHEGMTKG